MHTVHKQGLTLIRPKGPFGAGGGIPPEEPDYDKELIGFWEFDLEPVPGSITTYTYFSQQTIYAKNISGFAGEPYPATFSVTGVGGTISRVQVDLQWIVNNVSVDRAENLGVLLVGPTGVKVRLISDCGGATHRFTGESLSFAQDAAGNAPDTSAVGAGTYRPTQGATNNSGNACPTDFPAPAPTGPYSTNLNDFVGTNPNGTWSLYVIDDTNTSSFRRLEIGRSAPFEEVAAVLFLTVQDGTAHPALVGGIQAEVVGGPTIVPGKIGNGLNFDGTTDYVQLSPAAFSVLGPFTYIAWIYPTLLVGSTWRPIVTKGRLEGTLDHAMTLFNDSGTYRLGGLVEFNYGQLSILLSGFAFAINTWHFIAFGVSGTVGSFKGFLYANGNFQENTDPTPGELILTGPESRIGADGWSGENGGTPDYFFQGIIDDFGRFNRALSRSELDYLYNGGAGRRYPWQTLGMLEPGQQTNNRLMASDTEPLVGP